MRRLRGWLRRFPTSARRGASGTQPGTPPHDGAELFRRQSVDLPREGPTKCDPKRIAVRGTEWPASIGAWPAGFREGADVGGGDALLSQVREDLVRGMRLHCDQEGAFADRVERLHAEQFGTSATAGSTMTFVRSTSTPRPEAWAISHTAFRTPPSVASCMARTPSPPSPTQPA